MYLFIKAWNSFINSVIVHVHHVTIQLKNYFWEGCVLSMQCLYNGLMYTKMFLGEGCALFVVCINYLWYLCVMVCCRQRCWTRWGWTCTGLTRTFSAVTGTTGTSLRPTWRSCATSCARKYPSHSNCFSPTFILLLVLWLRGHKT